MNDSDALFLYFAMQNKSLHGNPGNISVFKMLMDNLYDKTIDDSLEKKFKKKYPKYKQEPGWLWILYKDESGKDIDKTIKQLDKLREM